MEGAWSGYMRVLVQNEVGLYLQPSGEWGENRDTARQFKDSKIAYYWAVEQRLLRSCVILAFPDKTRDMSIRVVW